MDRQLSYSCLATTNQRATPPLFGSLAAIGRERVLARLDAAEEMLERTT